MIPMSESVERTHSRWLGTSVVCCFPRLPEQSEPAPEPGECRLAMEEKSQLMIEALDRCKEICYEQPEPVLPPTFDFESIRPASRSSRPSQWLAEGRTLASRATSRASLTTRRTRASTLGSIGAPYDFKRVEPPRERIFRPLTLSIHIPGNELPSLPEFDEAVCDDKAGLTFPPPALTKSRSESMLSRPSTSFAIPRKPVPSRAVSMDVSRSSIDSHNTYNDLARTSHSIHRKPSIAASQSTQDFLDALDTRLPHPPPLLRAKSGPEPVYTLYRRASEQSLRLRTHLEERSQIERKFQECDTILEDKEGDLERSPVSPHPDNKKGGKMLPYQLTQPRSTEWFRTPLPPPPPSRRAPSPPSLSLASATRTRISQWLHSNPLTSPVKPLEQSPAPTPFYALRPSSLHKRTSVSSSSIYGSSTAADATPWTTPSRGSPHRKGSSLSSCLTSVQPVCAENMEYEKCEKIVGQGAEREHVMDGFMGEKLPSMGLGVEVRNVSVGVAF